MTYQPKVYREQGGARQVIASGGEIDIESGGAIKIAGTDVTSEVGQLAGLDRAVKTVKVALAAVDTAGGLFAWQNPEAVAVIVTRVVLDVTTAASSACTADVGPAADGTTLDDTLIDGVDVGTAAGLFDNVDNQGTNGASTARVDENGGTTDFVTGSVASGASAGIVGNVYISYVTV